MKWRASRPVVIAALLLSALASSACSMFGGEPDDPMDELREHVRSTVVDPGRVRSMLEVIDRMDASLAVVAGQFASTMQKKRALFQDYDSTREDFVALLEAGSYERQRLQRSIIDIHVEFKSHLSDEEWDVILPVQTRAVAAKTGMLVAEAFDR